MIYHYQTTNISFLKMASELKKRGIKNNRFFLILYDETLADVNPLDEENLTDEQKARIIREIHNNKFYYLREIVRIPAPGGLVRYELNRGNLALSWAKSMNLNVLMMLPRQNGKTIGVISDDTWIYHFGTTNSNILYGNKEAKDARMNLKRFKDISQALPKYLREYIFNEKEDTDNENSKISAKTNNTLTALSTGRDESSADKQGRGATAPILYWDEFAFLKYNKIILGAASPAQLTYSAVGKLL